MNTIDTLAPPDIGQHLNLNSVPVLLGCDIITFFPRMSDAYINSATPSMTPHHQPGCPGFSLPLEAKRSASTDGMGDSILLRVSLCICMNHVRYSVNMVLWQEGQALVFFYTLASAFWGAFGCLKGDIIAYGMGAT
jgi:hypothetical protein